MKYTCEFMKVADFLVNTAARITTADKIYSITCLNTLGSTDLPAKCVVKALMRKLCF